MFLLDEFRISFWAYEYCRVINDDPKIREFIVDSLYVYLYCSYIKDDPEVRKFINESYWAFMYCRYVNKDDERLMELAEKSGYKI